MRGTDAECGGAVGFTRAGLSESDYAISHLETSSRLDWLTCRAPTQHLGDLREACQTLSLSVRADVAFMPSLTGDGT